MEYWIPQNACDYDTYASISRDVLGYWLGGDVELNSSRSFGYHNFA
jgi:hypothetical protein